MFKRVVQVVALVTLVAGLGVVSPSTASTVQAMDATPAEKLVRITVMGINAPGKDTLANRNREYVWIRNTGQDEVNVFGWKLSDGYGNRFTFRPNKLKNLKPDMTTDATPAPVPDTLMLPAGHSVLIYTGAGKDTTPDNGVHAVYLDMAGHYLNNTSGETVTIKNRAGDVVDRISYDAYGINPTP
ncbi:lamin tail domain-containing protein [Nonomuraea sp. NPDC050786]|uniref:lamin tail domain-containing protein n=1 Tax=Nonomuraea sp. NPDC050786 TaxID=3154840 RepID=UPI0033FFEBC7